jgi:signal transduction histidine kinase
MDAAETFDDGSDPRVVFSLERILEEATADSQLVALLEDPASDRRELDSVATEILRASLLATLRSYEVSLTFVDASGQPRGRSYEADQQVSTTALEQLELSDFGLLRAMFADAGGQRTLVEQITGRHERERFRYLGLRPVQRNGQAVGWVMAGAEPHSTAEEVGVPFPRVFASTGFYGGIREDVSLAEFRDGVLVRTTGTSFGRFRLEEDVAEALVRSPSVWRRDRSRGRSFDTYYARQQGQGFPFSAEQMIVVAARTASTSVFDHLYALLRLTVAGMFAGIPIYLTGLVIRRKRGLLPAPRVRFRDKVLNAFFGVGVVTVAAMGFVGLRVVTDESDRAVDSWLRQHLERVERTLAAEARAGELPYRVLDRISLDSLSARVGLDLNLFQGTDLVGSSRPMLARDRLIDARLPIDAYRALNFDGFRFVSSEQTVGTFAYTAGYRALPDELGRPRYVVSVPTLPEQDRLDEERARTVAYLFGALLLLVLVVLATASVLANALTRPIARLRVGLEAVAQGRYEGIQPVNTRDEFGDLVETFNTMQGQLSDHRRRLAQQERQLAWQEMARQVAHEIKNPLTPMKLSVQHLQRSLESAEVDDETFKSVFARITRTLVEQIDALARIASEFSSFARMPQQVLEPLDINTVLREAATLMQAEGGTAITAEYADEPLVVSADREELRRAFINLLKNASQAVPSDRSARIRVRTSRIEDEGIEMVLCEIEDNGSGVPDELRDHIFEPNFSTKTSGTGLGLAIVLKAVEDIHGTIDFETRPGIGTTFRIKLPAV